MADTAKFYTAPFGPQAQPDVEAPRRARYEVSSSPAAFGALIAQGLTEFGKGAVEASNLYGNVAKDQAVNNTLGQMMSLRTQFENTQGQDTIDAYRGKDGEPGYQEKQQKIIDAGVENVPFSHRTEYYNSVRRYQIAFDNAGQSHFQQQSREWAGTVADSGYNSAINGIASHPMDDASFNNYSDAVSKAAVNKLETKVGMHVVSPGASQEEKDMVVNADQTARAHAWYTRIEAVRPTNPALALKWTNDNIGILGKLGPQVLNQLKSYQTQQETQSDVAVALGEPPRPVGVARGGEQQQEQPAQSAAQTALPVQQAAAPAPQTSAPVLGAAQPAPQTAPIPQVSAQTGAAAPVLGAAQPAVQAASVPAAVARGMQGPLGEHGEYQPTTGIGRGQPTFIQTPGQAAAPAAKSPWSPPLPPPRPGGQGVPTPPQPGQHGLVRDAQGNLVPRTEAVAKPATAASAPSGPTVSGEPVENWGRDVTMAPTSSGGWKAANNLSTPVKNGLAYIGQNFGPITLNSTTEGEHAQNSYHYLGMAADISIAGMDNQKLGNLIDTARAAGFTGFGLGQTHLHIDMRPTLGGQAMVFPDHDPGEAPVAGRDLISWSQRLNGSEAQQPQVATRQPQGEAESSLALIAQREGFRTNAYWDKNGWRVGYGSDTITHADGTVERVTRNSVVTQADAERDLMRRAEETQASIAAEVGYGRWNSLPTGTKAALTSMAYNYGLLPFNVQAAVRGGSSQDIASAIEAHAGDNGGINRGRRMQEASIVLGGAVPAMPGGGAVPAGGGGGIKFVSNNPASPDYSPAQGGAVPSTPAVRGGEAEGGGGQAQVQPASFGGEQGAGQPGFGVLGGAPEQKQSGTETVSEGPTPYDIQTQKLEEGVFRIQSAERNIMARAKEEGWDDARADRALKELKKQEEQALAAVGEDRATRARRSEEAQRSVMQLVDKGDYVGAQRAAKRAFDDGSVPTSTRESLDNMIERAKNKEEGMSSPRAHAYIDGILHNQIRTSDDIIRGFNNGELTWGDVGKLDKILTDHKNGDAKAEGIAVKTSEVLKRAEEWFKWEMQGPTPMTSIPNPKGRGMYQDFLKKFYGDKAIAEVDDPGLEKFPYFDGEKMGKLLSAAYPDRQRAFDQQTIGMTKETAAQEDAKWTPTPAPRGVDQASWSAVIANPPTVLSGFKMPHSEWDDNVRNLQADPTPGAKSWFDKHFGPQGDFAQGQSADDILKSLAPAGKPTAAAAPESPAASATLAPRAVEAIRQGAGAVVVGQPQPRNVFQPELRTDIEAAKKYFGTSQPIPPESQSGP